MCTEHNIMGISNYAINEDIREKLSSIAKNYGFEKFHVEITEGTTKGDGHTGTAETFRIYNSSNRNQMLNLYVKSAARDKSAREKLPIAEMFTTEIFMYNTIFPYFKDLEIRNGLTPSAFTPSYFGSILNDKNEVVILENLKEIGYSMHDCSKPLNSQHIRLVITQYAKHHSLSLALRDQQPELLKNLQSKLYDTFGNILKNMKGLIINKCTGILKFLDEVDSKRLRNFLENIECEFKDLVSPPIDEYSVILHGDCWMNNILFKYPKDSCNPTDVCLIDYQLSRLAPPVIDLAHFFFACSSEEDINRCNEYLDLYYQTLSTYLQKLGCDPNNLYPHSVFMKQWKKFAKFSALVAPVMLLIMLRTENEVVDLEDSVNADLTLSEMFNYDTTSNEEYNRRLKTIISYLVKNDLL